MALQYLDDRNKEFEVVEYINSPLSHEALKSTIQKLNITPYELLRRQEADFKANFKGKDLSDDQWIQAMIDYPKLMERPIVINQNKAVIARPTEKINEII